jgi:hypothetical protein
MFALAQVDVWCRRLSAASGWMCCISIPRARMDVKLGSMQALLIRWNHNRDMIE